MTEFKNPFKFGFKKKDKRQGNESKSAMFKSPSHYWTASQTDFLHSKGSANVELSIDPFNKCLIRIFCQSIDKMVNYKSMEYCAKTTVHQVIGKMIKVLRLNKEMPELILCEAVGRCMAINKDGSTENKCAKKGQAYLFIEQNRRVLMNSDYILTVLNYWKPMFGFSRRFELCQADKNNQMSSCDVGPDSSMEANDLTLSMYFSRNGSLSSLSQKSIPDSEERSTQTDFPVIGPPVAPRRKMSTKPANCPHLLTLKGEEDTDQSLMIPLHNSVRFGAPGSDAEVCLKRLVKYEKKIIAVFSKDSDSRRTFFENVCVSPDLSVTVNGDHVTDKTPILPGDIIGIGDSYSFFFKDNSQIPENQIKICNYVNSPSEVPSHASDSTRHHNGINYSDPSDHAVTSSSISSCSDVNVASKATMRSLKSRKKVSIDLNGITLACFDTALNQVIIHYFNDRMDLPYAVGFALYLIRFCQESARCSFTVDDMHERMTKRFCRTLEEAYNDDSYLICNLKLSALGFQMWMVYHNENYIETTEENRQWLSYLESFTSESFDHLSDYICETAKDMSLCVFDENPFVNIDQQQKYKEEDDLCTMEKFLNFLTDMYDKISKIGCPKTVDIFKRVITSRIVIALTESTVTVLLSDMQNFSWSKGIQISAQLEKLEDWFKKEGQFPGYVSDGFLHDFSKLVSTRSTILKDMDWKSLRHSYKQIPACVLRQFLSSLAVDDNRAMIKWQPPQIEVFESSKDVSAVLTDYLQTMESCTLFQPGITLQTDCIPIDKVIQSVEFISLCTVMDTELIGMAENFQWMALPKPPSLVNFKNSRWVALRQSIGDDTQETVLPQILLRRNIYSSEKKPLRLKLQTDSDYSSSSYKGEAITPSKKLIAKYHLHKSNMNLLSKSLVSLTEQDTKPKPPARKKYNGSVTSLSLSNQLTHHESSSSNTGSKSKGSISGKSCSARIGRSASFGSDISAPPPVVVDVDIDNSSAEDISDIDRTIEDMERKLQMSDPSNTLARLNLNSSHTPSIENGYYDDDDEDQMSVGLSAAEMVNRSKAKSKSSEAIINIDEAKTVEVTLFKSSDENYGITIADGMQTNLKLEGVYVYKISRNSPAYRSGKLKPGDQILAINNYSVEQLNFQECLMLMTKSMTSLKLYVEKADLQKTMRIMSLYQ